MRETASHRGVGRAGRLLTGLLVPAAAAGALRWAVGSPATTVATLITSPHAEFDPLLIASLGIAAWCCLAWFALAVALEVASLAPGAAGHHCERIASRVGPRLLRRSARWLVGVTMLTGPLISTPALAASATSPPPSLDRPVATAPAHPGVAGTSRATAPDLDRPVSPYLPPPPPAPVKTASTGSAQVLTGTPHREIADGHYVVRAGDALWDVAARHLGPDATAVEIAREWPRWYAANRDTIGADPNLIRPGELLRPPA